jgi:hypothetical protein
MNVVAVLRALRRRWYIVVPGILVAVVAAVGAWAVVPPDYERSATQLLLPGADTLPEGSSNPFLFLGGLTSAADVIVRAAGSDDNVREITGGSDIDVVVSRDPLNAGPAILTTVTAPTDRSAASVLDAAIQRTTELVQELQAEQGIAPSSRISVTLVTRDGESTLQQRSRATMTVGVGLGMAILTVLLAALVDGLARRKGRRGRPDEAPSGDPFADAEGPSPDDREDDGAVAADDFEDDHAYAFVYPDDERDGGEWLARPARVGDEVVPARPRG